MSFLRSFLSFGLQNVAAFLTIVRVVGELKWSINPLASKAGPDTFNMRLTYR